MYNVGNKKEEEIGMVSMHIMKYRYHTATPLYSVFTSKNPGFIAGMPFYNGNSHIPSNKHTITG